MIKGAILDLDGVLFRGSEPIPGSVEAVNTMVETGLKILYLSNNSTMTREMLLKKLVGMGYPPAPVITSAMAASQFLLERMGICRCLVLGEEGLIGELVSDGHEVHPCGEERGAAPFKPSPWNTSDGTPISALDVDAVVAGLDRTLTYTRIADAMLSIRRGALFVATNEDPTLPWSDGIAIPGAGSIISALRTCTGVDPIVVGKPETYSTIMAIRKLDLDPSEILMIGDRIDTDIEAGKRCGTNAALVLTGEVSDPGDVDYPVYCDLLELVRSHKLM